MKNESKLNQNVSRGYAGYFENWYLRSLLEFKVAKYMKYLESRFKSIDVKYEPGYLTFKVGNKNYKPDFILYRNSKIFMIVEVKPDAKAADNYLSLYREYFKNSGIKYLVIYSSRHYRHIEQVCNLTQEDFKNWKYSSIYDYSGKNNPAFGMKWSDEAKTKIGQKTKERCKDEVYLQKLKKSISNSMTSEIRNKISASRKEFGKKQREIFEKNNPEIEFTCDLCKSTYFKRECDDYNYQTFGFRSCSKGCTQKQKLKSGIKTGLNIKWDENKKRERFKQSLRNAGTKVKNEYALISEETIQLARKHGIINKNSGLSIKSINNFFGSLENLEKEI